MRVASTTTTRCPSRSIPEIDSFIASKIAGWVIASNCPRRSRVGEDDLPQALPVDRPVVPQDPPAERFHDRVVRTSSRGRHFPRDPVGVEDRDPRLAQHRGHRAFPRADVPRQSEDPHAREYTIRVDNPTGVGVGSNGCERRFISSETQGGRRWRRPR